MTQRSSESFKTDLVHNCSLHLVLFTTVAPGVCSGGVHLRDGRPAPNSATAFQSPGALLEAGGP